MTLTKSALLYLSISLVLIVAGVVVVSTTPLGLLGWFLIGGGLVLLIFAVTRPRRDSIAAYRSDSRGG